MSLSQWSRRCDWSLGVLGLSQPFEAGGTVVVADDIQCLLVGGDADAVGLAGIADDAVDRSVGIDTVDAHHGLLDGLVPEIPGVTEVETSLEIDGDVIGRVQFAALEHAGHDVTHPGLHVGACDSLSTVVGALADDHVAPGVELDAVGHTRGGPEDFCLVCFRVVLPDVAGVDGSGFGHRLVREGDVTEVDHPIGSDRDTLGQDDAVEEFLELGTGRDDGVGGQGRRQAGQPENQQQVGSEESHGVFP